MMRGMGDLQKMMKQAQKMQESMAKVQAELADKYVEGSAGGGAVTVVVSGTQDIRSIKIRPDAVDPEDIETLEDLVLAAVRDGLQKSSEMAKGELNAITGGMNIPGL
ncbi:MAG TPA: YbaB/EbfC family nucleoid-associated protein [Chroococcales cyanobacterium]